MRASLESDEQLHVAVEEKDGRRAIRSCYLELFSVPGKIPDQLGASSAWWMTTLPGGADSNT